MNKNNSPTKPIDHVAVNVNDDEPRVSEFRSGEWYRESVIGDDFDQDFLHRIVADTGRWAYGTVFVEVWILSENRTQLIRPINGWWLDPVFHTDCGKDCKLCTLIDPVKSGDTILAPGVGLPGVLWAEGQGGNPINRMSGSTARASQMLNPVGRRSALSMGSSGIDNFSSAFNEIMTSRKVHWREVRAIAMDPDLPKSPRIDLLLEVGLGWTAGVTFQMGRTDGVVVYMARESSDLRKLTDPINEAYLLHASMLIGSAYNLRAPRKAVTQVRHQDCHDAFDRIRKKIQACHNMGINLADLVDENSKRKSELYKPETTDAAVKGQNACASIAQYIVKKLKTSFKKFWGANIRTPPRFSWKQSAWTFFGAFITLLVLTSINKRLVDSYGPNYAIVLGPFGALMTLQYGLTAAPASQPGNAILGQTFALVIAHSIGQASRLKEFPWLQQSLATALAIAVMVKLGITHPPAGAAALLFSTGTRTWPMVGIMLMGNVIAIIFAVVVNNLNDHRQYPTSWGLRKVHKIVFGDSKKKET